MAQKVTTGVYKGVTTSELDDLAAETAASMTATHPDYATVSTSDFIALRRLAHTFILQEEKFEQQRKALLTCLVTCSLPRE